MNWHFEQRMEESSIWGLVPRSCLVGDEGVVIRMDYSKSWFLEYRSEDLFVKLWVNRDFRDTDSENTVGQRSDDLVLGFNCIVYLDRRSASRPLKSEDYSELVNNVKDALRVHWQIPFAPPPRIEKVRFLNKELQRFDD